MNIIVSMAVGLLAGWISHSYLGLNEGRGRFATLVIGGMGGFVGAKLIAPMFVTPSAAGDNFSASAIFFAVIVASACLFLGDWVNKRWDV